MYKKNKSLVNIYFKNIISFEIVNEKAVIFFVSLKENVLWKSLANN